MLTPTWYEQLLRDTKHPDVIRTLQRNLQKKKKKKKKRKKKRKKEEEKNRRNSPLVQENIPTTE